MNYPSCDHLGAEDRIDPRELEGCLILLWAVCVPEIYDAVLPLLDKQRRELRRVIGKSR